MMMSSLGHLAHWEIILVYVVVAVVLNAAVQSIVMAALIKFGMKEYFKVKEEYIDKRVMDEVFGQKIEPGRRAC